MSKRPHIVILGGGYVGIGAIKVLRSAIRRREVDVTVIDRENYKCYHGWVAEFVVGRVGPSNLLNSNRRIYRGAKLVLAEIEGIDVDDQTVAVSRNFGGIRDTISYDHLIIALGSVDNLEMYPGLVEHAFKLKTYDDCFRLRTHLITMFEMAEQESDPVERRRLLTFFIAGGGYAGAEVAGEIAEHATRLCAKEYRGIDRSEVRVVLVHPDRTILPELMGPDEEAPRHPGLVAYATKWLQRQGVEVLTQSRVSAASPNEVSLSTGERVPTHTIISAVGTSAPPLIAHADFPKDARGRLAPDAFLRLGDRGNIWTGGDCAAVRRPSGGLCPHQALYARNHGITAGRNILRTVRGEALQPFEWEAIGQGVPLGGRKAVGELKGIPVKGTFAWALMKCFLVYYTPTWDRRLRLLADWALAGIIGRDVVDNSVADSDDYEMRHHLYQAGEIISREGRLDRYVHVIVEGEVELLHGSNGHEVVFQTLGPGQHFGQVWRDHTMSESARAKGTVRTVTLRADQTRDIQRLMAHLQELVADSVYAEESATANAASADRP